METERALWDKRSSETAQAFEAFAIYRGLGVQRNLSAVARQLSKSIQLISRWSIRHEWKRRVDAWHVHLDEDIQLQEREDHRSMRKIVFQTSKELHKRALQALLATAPALMRPGSDGAVQVANMKPGEIAKWLELSNKLASSVMGKMDDKKPAKIEVIIGSREEQEAQEARAV